MDDDFDQFDDETLVGYIIETLEHSKQDRDVLLQICAMLKRVPPSI